jgi:DNA repair photolyase
MGESVNKMLGNQVVLTSDDIRQWQEDITAAEHTKAEAEAMIADRRRKLDAAAIFGVRLDPIIPESGNGSESMRAAVERILSGFDRAIEHHQLQAELRKTPRFAEMLNKHKGAYYYTLISRLTEDKKIKKVGRKLRLIHKNEALSEGNPEGALQPLRKD